MKWRLNMKKEKISSKDLLLAFLYSPGISDEVNEPIIGRTKLMKMMFLFEKEIAKNFFNNLEDISLPNFEPYYYGPFSRQLFEDLAFFEAIGMIVTNETDIPLPVEDIAEAENVFDNEVEEQERYESSYSLSDAGKKYIEENIWNTFLDGQKDILRRFKAQINKISLNGLLRYVYTKYPETTKKSVIADKFK